jgi:hypothetical protein
MPFTKLYMSNKNECAVQIYAEHYFHTLDHISKLVAELRKDYNVSDKNIEVREFGGTVMRGRIYIRAELPKGTKIREGYKEIDEFEDYLS